MILSQYRFRQPGHATETFQKKHGMAQSPRRSERADLFRADLFRAGWPKALAGRLGAGVEAVSLPVLIWLYGPTLFGLYAAAWAAVRLASVICEAGAGPALQRFGGLQPAAVRRAMTSRALSLALPLCLGVVILTAIAGPAVIALLPQAGLTPDQHRRLMALALVWLPLWTALEIVTAALRAGGGFGPELRVRLLYEQGSRLAGAIGLWALGWTVAGLFLAPIVSISVALALALRPLLAAEPAAAPAPGLRRFGLVMMPAVVIRRLISEAPVLILGVVSGAVAAGLFVLARKLASAVQLLTRSSDHVVAPLAAGQPAEAQAALGRQALSRALCYGPPLAAVLLGLAPVILPRLDPAYAGGTLVVAVLVLARLAEALTGPALALVEVAGRPRQPLLLALAALAVLLLLSGLLIPPLGALGAAMASLAAGVSAPLLALGLLPYPLHQRGFVRALAPRLIGLAALAAMGWTLAEPMPLVAATAVLILGGGWALIAARQRLSCSAQTVTGA